MRQLVLTALATEHDLMNGGAEYYFLVFNNGELRIPVPSETAEAVIRALYGDGETPAPSQGFEREEIEERRQPVIAETKRDNHVGVVLAQVGSTYSDEDGVDQV